MTQHRDHQQNHSDCKMTQHKTRQREVMDAGTTVALSPVLQKFLY